MGKHHNINMPFIYRTKLECHSNFNLFKKATQTEKKKLIVFCRLI